MALPAMSIITIALAVFESIMTTFAKIMEHASDAQRERLIAIMVENLEWWQTNVWRKLGDLLDGPDDG